MALDFSLSADQEAIADTFGAFFAKESPVDVVRGAEPVEKGHREGRCGPVRSGKDRRNASVLFADGLRIQDGRRSQFTAVGDLTPKWVGPGDGWVEIAALTARPAGRLAALVSDVQNAIDNKTKRCQMGNCSDPKWLAVVVNVCELEDRYGAVAHDRNQTQHVVPDGIRFDYFDEVWVCSLSGSVVLRLLKGETQMTVAVRYVGRGLCFANHSRRRCRSLLSGASSEWSVL